MNTTDLRTPQDRFGAAVSDLRKNGVAFHRNVRQCCRGCVTPEQIGLKDESDETPYVWTYGSQNSAISFDASTGQPYRRHDGKPAETMYLYHGNGGGQKAADAFRAQGLTVEWDGSDSHAVEIKF